MTLTALQHELQQAKDDEASATRDLDKAHDALICAADRSIAIGQKIAQIQMAIAIKAVPHE